MRKLIKREYLAIVARYLSISAIRSACKATGNVNTLRLEFFSNLLLLATHLSLASPKDLRRGCNYIPLNWLSRQPVVISKANPRNAPVNQRNMLEGNVLQGEIIKILTVISILNIVSFILSYCCLTSLVSQLLLAFPFGHHLENIIVKEKNITTLATCQSVVAYSPRFATLRYPITRDWKRKLRMFVR